VSRLPRPPEPGASFEIVPSSAVEPRRGVVSVLSSVKRVGPWSLARQTRVVATLGEVVLDLRHATVGEGASEVELFAFMGNVKLVVPPGIRVLTDVDTFAGSVDVKGRRDVVPGPDAPTVRVRGTAAFASVEVVFR